MSADGDIAQVQFEKAQCHSLDDGKFTAHPPHETLVGSLGRACEWDNRTLFNGRLPPWAIRLKHGIKDCSYLPRDGFIMTGGAAVADEIVINPTPFSMLGQKMLHWPPGFRDSPLIHEVEDAFVPVVAAMAELARYRLHSPKPNRGYRRDKLWRDIMRDVGLPPQGRDGKEIKVQENGPFAIATWQLMGQGFRVPYLERDPLIDDDPAAALRRQRKSESKTAYRCPHGHLVAWAILSAKVKCGHCDAICVRDGRHGS